MGYTYYDYLENYYEEYYYPVHFNMTGVEWEQPYNMKIATPLYWGWSFIACAISIALAVAICYQVFFNSKSDMMSTSVKCFYALTAFFGAGLCCIDPWVWYVWYVDYDPTSLRHWHIWVPWEECWFLCRTGIYCIFMHRYYGVYVACALFDQTYCLYQRAAKYAIFGSFCVLMFTYAVCHYGFMWTFYNYDGSGGENVFGASLPDAHKTRFENFSWAKIAIDSFLVLGLTGLFGYTMLRLIARQEKDRLKHEQAREFVFSTTPSTTEVNLSEQVSKNASSPTASNSQLQTATPTASSSQLRAQTSTSERKRKAEAIQKENNLLHLVVKISITTSIALATSVGWYVAWTIASKEEAWDVYFFTLNNWTADYVVNLTCIYLTLGASQAHYKKVCNDCCHCHQCCLSCFIRMLDCYVNRATSDNAQKENNASSGSASTQEVTL